MAAERPQLQAWQVPAVAAVLTMALPQTVSVHSAPSAGATRAEAVFGLAALDAFLTSQELPEMAVAGPMGTVTGETLA